MFELREGDKRAFFRTPFEAYGADSLYVSPMWPDIERYFDATKNPLFAAGNPFKIFTAHRNGKPIGRISAHLHRASNERHGFSRAFFGYFDVADDAEAADALLNAALRFAKEQGCAELAGNFNLTAMQQCGVMTDGFENAPYTDMVYAPPHVSAHLRRNGFEAFFPMTTWEIDLATADADSLVTDKVRAAFASPKLSWKPIDRRHFTDRLEDARVVLNDGFDQNPMFVPLTKEEYDFHAKEMALILDPRIAACVHEDGKPVGVIVCIPDLNPFMRAVKGEYGLTAPFEFIWHRLDRRRAVIIYYSTARSHHGRGLNSAMLFRVITRLRRAGYEKLGVTWVADENGASLRQMEKIGARKLHRLHLFRKAVA